MGLCPQKTVCSDLFYPNLLLIEQEIIRDTKEESIFFCFKNDRSFRSLPICVRYHDTKQVTVSPCLPVCWRSLGSVVCSFWVGGWRHRGSSSFLPCSLPERKSVFNLRCWHVNVFLHNWYPCSWAAPNILQRGQDVGICCSHVNPVPVKCICLSTRLDLAFFFFFMSLFSRYNIFSASDWVLYLTLMCMSGNKKRNETNKQEKHLEEKVGTEETEGRDEQREAFGLTVNTQVKCPLIFKAVAPSFTGFVYTWAGNALPVQSWVQTGSASSPAIPGG